MDLKEFTERANKLADNYIHAAQRECKTFNDGIEAILIQANADGVDYDSVHKVLTYVMSRVTEEQGGDEETIIIFEPDDDDGEVYN